jgi:hypothetical protein
MISILCLFAGLIIGVALGHQFLLKRNMGEALVANRSEQSPPHKHLYCSAVSVRFQDPATPQLSYAHLHPPLRFPRPPTTNRSR